MNKFLRTNWLVLAAIVMIAGSLGPFPYVYDQLTNWMVAIAALTVALAAKNRGQKTYMWLFVVAAVIFNPIAPIYLTADQWRIADIAAIVLFAISMFKVRKQA
jgi:FtsH-binding integral membrane protein